MNSFWLFRSNIKELEYYHEFKDLKTFKEKCHDYYMLLPLWLLENNYVNEVVIWRLTKKYRKPIIFNINGKKYIQRWCLDFVETLAFPEPEISFFRGGFKEYDQLTKAFPKRLGFKIYLGAGQRISAQWGGKYDLFLMEDDDDLRNNNGTYPFYKTASSSIFFPSKNVSNNINWDICWPCNFSSIRYKGQEFFIREVAKSKLLRRLRIVHCGNKSDIGKKMCKDYGVENIEFLGPVDRPTLNSVLNQSKVGLNLSNRLDGCPRVSTEILMSGTPLIIHEKTRLLSYYKNRGVIQVNNNKISKQIILTLEKYLKYKVQVLEAINNELSFANITKKNIELWKLLKT